MLIKTLALSLLALAACATATQAQTTVLDNLSSTYGIGFKGPASGTQVSGAFMTGLNPGTLADVMFPQISQPTDAQGNFIPSIYYYNYLSTESFSLYSTNPATGLAFTTDPITGLALAPLVKFNLAFGTGSTTPSASTAGAQTVGTVPSDAVSQAGATLAPNTKYWLVLNSGNTGAAVSWDFNPGNTYVNYGSGYSIPPSGDVSAVTKIDGSTAQYTVGAQRFYLSVVPEPSTYCLMAVAGLALVVSRKRTAKVA